MANLPIDQSQVDATPLSSPEIQRYARHLSIPEVGPEGQKRLRAASILCIGAGGLGSPITMYLAAAGVGRIGLVDFDKVDLSNLQRQILHGESDTGRPKIESAAETLREINPHVRLDLHDTAFTAESAPALAEPYDLIIDGTDNFPTRYLSNDIAVWQKKPNVYGSIFRFEGQVSVFAPHLGGPCYRCLFPEPPKPGLVPSCAEGGVLGVVPGIVGSLQALEAVKLILGLGDSLVGRLVHFDGLKFRFREFKLRRDPDCPVCGEKPSITEPVDYEAFCGVPSGESSGAGKDAEVPCVSVQELQQRMDRGANFTLLDVREESEYAICRIPGSRLIPLGELESRLHELPEGHEILVHCKAGPRGTKAVKLLKDRGFGQVYNVSGGILAWAEEIDTSVPKY